jgi:hypothetical protein
VTVAGPATVEPRVLVPLHQHEQHARGRSFEAPNVSSLPLDNRTLRTVTIVQGRAIAQAVSRRLPKAAARVQTRV